MKGLPMTEVVAGAGWRGDRGGGGVDSGGGGGGGGGMVTQRAAVCIIVRWRLPGRCEGYPACSCG